MAFIHIAGNTYELIFENRNGWNVEAFRNRYSEVLERYDYIVGDWGYNQLRLKGFFRDGHQKATKDSTYSYMTDYINEYCNFGCAYFIIEKKQGSEALETSDDDIFIEELEYIRPVPVPREQKSKDKDKSATVSSAEDNGGANQKDQPTQRSKRAAHRDKSGHDSASEDGSHEKPRPRNQRQGSSKQKHAQQDNADASSDTKQEHKKEGKPKRKDFHRRGPRPFDKKNKGPKGQNNEKEKASNAITNE